jgi:hypothetical protein
VKSLDEGTRPAGHRAGRLAPAVLILLLFVAVRLPWLLRLPMFLDEAIHLERARLVLDGQMYVGLRDGKMLHPILMACFDPTGTESLWLGRAVSVLLGVLACAGGIALGTLLSSRRAGWLAGLVYIVLPFAVFHDRQVLVDPMMSALVLLAMALSVRMAGTPRWRYVLPLAVCLAAAYLTKLAALPYFGVPLLAAVLLAKRRETGWRAALLAVLAIGLAAGMVAVVLQIATREVGGVNPTYLPSPSKLRASDGGLASLVATAPHRLAQGWRAARRYFGVWAMGVAALSAVFAWRGGRWRKVAFLWALVFGLPSLLVVADRPTPFFPSRYLMPMAAPLAALAAISATWAFDRLHRAFGTAGRMVGLALAGMLLLPPLPYDLTLMAHPERASLARSDRTQYFEGDPAGVGHVDVARMLLDYRQAHPDQTVDVIAVGSDVFLAGYLGQRDGRVVLWKDSESQKRELGEWLGWGHTVFFADHTLSPLPEAPYGASVEQVATFPAPLGEMHLYRVVGTQDKALLDAIFEAQFVNPHKLEEDYRALAAHLAADPTPRALAAYPPNQADLIAGLLADQPLEVEAVGESWPLDLPEATGLLGDLAGRYDRLQIVFLEEWRGDPDRQIETWLNRNLFRLSVEWFGPLRLVTYATYQEARPAPTATGATFGDIIELSQAQLFDPEPSPGDVVRVRLEWRALEAPDRSYNVFVHLVGPDEGLIAQHDGIPAGELAPTDTWSPGRQVIDQFAIALPADTPPGEYQVRVGLYDPNGGARLPVTTDGEHGPDWALIGSLTVR